MSFQCICNFMYNLKNAEMKIFMFINYKLRTWTHTVELEATQRYIRVHRPSVWQQHGPARWISTQTHASGKATWAILRELRPRYPQRVNPQHEIRARRSGTSWRGSCNKRRWDLDKLLLEASRAGLESAETGRGQSARASVLWLPGAFECEIRC